MEGKGCLYRFEDFSFHAFRDEGENTIELQFGQYCKMKGSYRFGSQ